MVTLHGLIHRLKSYNHTVSQNKQQDMKVLFSSFPKSGCTAYFWNRNVIKESPLVVKKLSLFKCLCVAFVLHYCKNPGLLHVLLFFCTGSFPLPILPPVFPGHISVCLIRKPQTQGHQRSPAQAQGLDKRPVPGKYGAVMFLFPFLCWWTSDHL